MIRDHELEFYDRYLKDVDNGWDARPPAELYVLGANEWRGESEWPLARTQPTPFHLRQSGGLSVDEPRSDESADRYDYDPADPVPTIGGVNSVLTMTQGAETPIRPGPIDQRVLERRDDVLVYTSEPLESDLEVVGPVEMVLYAASTALDTDFIVRLCDVYPDGRSIFLTEGIIRARYRGSLEGESVELLEPGEVAEYRIRCYPVANVFKRGPLHPARRDELELPALLPQPQYRRGRRHRDAHAGGPADRAPYERVSIARRAARHPRVVTRRPAVPDL